MRGTSHVLLLTGGIVALGFVLAAGVLAGGIHGAAVGTVWGPAGENGGQLAVTCVLASVVLGGLVGLLGQFVQLSREACGGDPGHASRAAPRDTGAR